MVVVKWERYPCTLRETIFDEHHKAIYLFQVAPSSPCGTVLFRTKPIWCKRTRRLVGVCVFYILGGGYIAYGNVWLPLSSLIISCLNCVCKGDQNVPRWI